MDPADVEDLDQYTDDPASSAVSAPSGDHPLEVAARRGIGPLSPLSQAVWHGDSTPCVSCGQIVRRGAAECEDCGQDLSEEMLGKMRVHAGPWYVLEHLRPFPGVSLERIIRQIRRGLITEVSIVRGPSTDYQWRYAVETPGLCRYFGKCWNCHHAVGPMDTYCPSCLSYLFFEKPVDPRPLPRADFQPRMELPPAGQVAPAATAQPARPVVPQPLAAAGPSSPLAASIMASAAPAPPAHRTPTAVAPALPSFAPVVVRPAPMPQTAQGSGGAAELARLADAVRAMDNAPREENTGGFSAAHAGWIAACFLILAVLLLLWATSARSDHISDAARPPAPPSRGVQAP